jgi:hypothetical protein
MMPFCIIVADLSQLRCQCAVQDQPNINKGWANASWERRQEIIAEHTYFEMGTFFYLANDPKVPQKIR